MAARGRENAEPSCPFGFPLRLTLNHQLSALNLLVLEILSPLRGLGVLGDVDPGCHSQTRLALGYYLSGLQPFSLGLAPVGFPSLATLFPGLVVPLRGKQCPSESVFIRVIRGYIPRQLFFGVHMRTAQQRPNPNGSRIDDGAG